MCGRARCEAREFLVFYGWAPECAGVSSVIVVGIPSRQQQRCLWLQATTGPRKGDYMLRATTGWGCYCGCKLQPVRARATTCWGCYRGCMLHEKEIGPGPWSRPLPSWRAMMGSIPEPTTHCPRSAVETGGWQSKGRGRIRIRLFSGGVNGAKEEGLDSGTKLGGSYGGTPRATCWHVKLDIR